MRRMLNIFFIAAISLCLSSCLKFSSNPSLSEPALASVINDKTSTPIIKSDIFLQSDTAIYFSFKKTDLPKNTSIKARWKNMDNGLEIVSEITVEGSGYEVFTLKRNEGLFPEGKYEVTVSAQVNGKNMELTENFSITTAAKLKYLSNPVTSKGIDSSDKLNPVNVTSEFSQSDPVIYFIVQSNNIPQNTKITCTWLYIDTGDILTHELVTDGSRSIAFSLKPNGNQKLPSGKYVVTVTAVINNGTESVSKTFEIKN